jgi:hypothetical protein
VWLDINDGETLRKAGSVWPGVDVCMTVLLLDGDVSGHGMWELTTSKTERTNLLLNDGGMRSMWTRPAHIEPAASSRIQVIAKRQLCAKVLKRECKDKRPKVGKSRERSRKDRIVKQQKRSAG